MEQLTNSSGFLVKIDQMVTEKLAANDFQINQKDIRSMTLKSEMELKRAKWQERQMPPLAIVPTRLWKHLCKKFDIYRFEHFFENGHVPFVETTFTPLSESNIIKTVSWILAIGVCIFSSLFWSLFILFFSGLLQNFIESDYKKRAKANGTSDAQIYFPEKYSDKSFIFQDEFGGFKYSSIGIHFIKEPALIASLKVRLRGINQPFCIASEEDGFKLNTKSILHHDTLMQQDGDPIIYVNDGDWTIILGQYGNFSRENDMIAYVETLCITDFIHESKL